MAPPIPDNDNDLERRVFVVLEDQEPPPVWLVLGFGMCLGVLLSGVLWLTYLMFR